MIPFGGNKMKKLFLARFRYHHCFVNIIMQPLGYFKSPHLAFGAIWVWDLTLYREHKPWT